MIERKRIMSRLNCLYEIGRQSDGTHARIAYTAEDKSGRKKFALWAKNCGAEIRLDKAGNLIARFNGKNPDLPVILIGSHLDTVPDGGKFDGAFGCVGALEVMEYFREKHFQPDHSIEIVVFNDEEGIFFGKGLTGSNAMSGQRMVGFSPEDTGLDGRTREEVFREYGFEYETMQEAARDSKDVHCFLEMHVEQGKTLDSEKICIGAVTAIAGVRRMEITVCGEANHSGSTRMNDRKDALVAASGFICSVPGIVKKYGDEYTVATVGKIEAEPGVVNVIPGSCTFLLEIRDQDDKRMENLLFQVRKDLDNNCEKEGCTWKQKLIASYASVPMNQTIINMIEDSCRKKDIPCRCMPSGAFHDAMFMGKSFPTGMIFVPSIGGWSHSPREDTAEEDLVKGCLILRDTVLRADRVAEF